MFMGDKHEITMPFVRNSSQIPAHSQDSNSFETHAAVDSEDSSVGSPVNAAVGNLVSLVRLQIIASPPHQVYSYNKRMGHHKVPQRRAR